MRDRREASAGNWMKHRPDRTVGITKASRQTRKSDGRARAKSARKSRKANRGA